MTHSKIRAKAPVTVYDEIAGARSWQETLVLVTIFLLLAALMAAPAFKTYFFSENFNYLGQYRTYGSNLWHSLTSPSGGVRFRYQPVFFLASLPWHFILPVDPLAYHLRNFVFIVTNFLLLHRILLRLVASRLARIIGLALFALSKIHLTTIGYINLFDSIVLLTLLLCTVLFFVRYLQEQRRSDYVLGLIFGSLSIFSKDYGLVIIPVILMLVLGFDRPRRNWRSFLLKWTIRLLPLAIVALAYLWIHYVIAGAPPTDDPAYSPALRPALSLARVLIFLSTIGNLSIFPSAITGASGIGSWPTLTAAWLSRSLPSQLSLIGTKLSLGDSFLCLLLLILLLVTLVRARSRWLVLLFPLVWMAVYLAPTFLVSNVQLYYNQESLAGLAILVALCLDQSAPMLRQVWSAAIILIGISGFVSNWRSATLYTWAYEATLAEKARVPLIDAYKGKAVDSITFITSGRSRHLWMFVLGSTNFPLLPEVMHRPQLRVNYIGYQNVSEQLKRTNPSNLLIDIENGFLFYPEQIPPALVLKSLLPERATADEGFNLQPGGKSALIANASNVTPGTRIVFDHHKLISTVHNKDRVTGLLPRELLLKPGQHDISLNDGLRKSNSLAFTIAAQNESSSSNGKAAFDRQAQSPAPTALEASRSYLTANPNPVPYSQEPGVTTIRWDTGDGSWGEIYVAMDGGEKRLLADGVQGTARATWIQPNTRYHFELELDSDDELATPKSVDVWMVEKP